MTDFSPREIVSELDRFIVGQADAKRAVSIALRNRWRRQQLTGSLRMDTGLSSLIPIRRTAALSAPMKRPVFEPSRAFRERPAIH